VGPDLSSICLNDYDLFKQLYAGYKMADLKMSSDSISFHFSFFFGNSVRVQTNSYKPRSGWIDGLIISYLDYGSEDPGFFVRCFSVSPNHTESEKMCLLASLAWKI